MRESKENVNFLMLQKELTDPLDPASEIRKDR